MSKLMDTMALMRLFLLIFSSCIITSHCGSHHGSRPSCEVEVKVRRGTVCKASPQQHLEIKCPVQHCGETVQVVWCKLLDTNECNELSDSKQVQMNKTKQQDGNLVSFLTFKRISVQDEGLYACKENKHNTIGHYINVTVSETHQGDRICDDGNSDKPSTNASNDDDITSLVLFSICLSIVLLLFTITGIVLLRFNFCECILRHHIKTQEEASNHTVPDLPKRSPYVLQNSLSMVNDIYSSVTLTSPHSETNNRNPPVANAIAPLPGCGLYAVINRTQHDESFHKSSIGQGTNSENNAIRVLDNPL